MTIVTFGAVFGAQGVASADCGMHAFETNAVPLLQKVQSTPLTPENLFRNTVYGSSRPDRPALPHFILAASPCSDEPAMKNAAANALQRYWTGALLARGQIAALSHVLAGETTADPRCNDYTRLATRAFVAGQYAIAAQQFDAVPIMMKYGPRYWAIIKPMWAEALAAEHLTPPSAGASQLVFEAWVDQLQKPADIEKEHLPNTLVGICNPDPTLNYINLPKPQSFIPESPIAHG